jgi:hypothetical protein
MRTIKRANLWWMYDGRYLTVRATKTGVLEAHYTATCSHVLKQEPYADWVFEELDINSSEAVLDKITDELLTKAYLARKKARAASPSGKHTTARRKVARPDGGWNAQDAAAKAVGLSWSEWAFECLEEAARR